MSMARADSLNQIAHGVRKYAGWSASQILAERVASGLCSEDRAYFRQHGALDARKVAAACQNRHRGWIDPLKVV